MSAWNPQLYLKFGAERTRPAADLVARIDIAVPRRVIDLGCGTGNSTAILRARWPAAEITGLDSDPEMLAVAKQSDASVRWENGDAAVWEPTEPYDVVFSNAMLQWLSNHAVLVPRLFGAVAAGGALAVQIPIHLQSALHRHILEVANEPEWRGATRQGRVAIGALAAADYYDLLCPLAQWIDLWESEYYHIMDGPEDILTWIRGTGLRPFLDSLSSDRDRARFESLLLERVTQSYSRRGDGKVLFPFRRLFFVAYRDDGSMRGVL